MNRNLLFTILTVLISIAASSWSRAVADDKADPGKVSRKESTTMSGFERWRAEQQRLLQDDSVIACYAFQEGKGTSLANQSKTGSALDGTITDGQWEQGRWPGKHALRFNGASTVVEIPSADALCPLDKTRGGTGEMTVEAWVKLARMGNAGIVDKSSNGTGNNTPYAIWMTASRLSGCLGMQPADQIVMTADGDVLDKGEWIHVAITANDEMLCLYRNGVRVGVEKRKQVASSDNGQPLLIGAIGKNFWPLNGWIDEVVIHNKALSEAEMKQRASFVPDPIELPGPPALIMRWPAGGESVPTGSWHRILWDSHKVSDQEAVAIDLSTDDGKTWTPLAASAPNTGEFVWETTAQPSANCRVRVTASQLGVVAQNDSAFSIVPAEEIPGYEWVKVTLDAAFPPCDGPGALVYKDRMWLIGGWNPNDKKNFPRICTNSVWSSQDGLEWVLEKPNSFLDKTFDAEQDWEGRHTAGYVVYKDKMWIVGGDANQGHYQNDVWSSTDGKAWDYVNKGAPVPWGPRVLHHTLVFRDKIWVMGGQTIPSIASAEEKFYRDIWTTTDGVTWEQVVPSEPYWPQRGLIGGNVVFKDRMWILGGGTYETPEVPRRKMYNDVWSSADGVTWQCHLEKAPWDAREYHDVAAFDGRMWVMEGAGPAKMPRNRNDVWHSADGVNWYPLPNTPWPARHAAAVYVHDDALWMVTGNNMTSDVWKLVRKSESAD